MKKIWLWLFIVILSIGLVGCGEDEDKGQQKTDADKVQKPVTSGPSAPVSNNNSDKETEESMKNLEVQTIVVSDAEDLRNQVEKQMALILVPEAQFVCVLHHEKGEGPVIDMKMNVLDLKADLDKKALWQAHVGLMQEIAKFKGDYKYNIVWQGNKGTQLTKEQSRGQDDLLKTVILSEKMGDLDFSSLTPEDLEKAALKFYMDASLK